MRVWHAAVDLFQAVVWGIEALCVQQTHSHVIDSFSRHWPSHNDSALLQGMMEGGLSAAGMRGGQTPQISANYAFDMNTSLQM